MFNAFFIFAELPAKNLIMVIEAKLVLLGGLACHSAQSLFRPISIPYSMFINDKHTSLGSSGKIGCFVDSGFLVLAVVYVKNLLRTELKMRV